MPKLTLPTLSRTLIRNGLVVLVAVDLVVLAAFSVRVSTTTTRTTSAPAAVPVTTTGLPSAPTTPAPVDAGVPLGSSGVPIADINPTPGTPTTKPRSPKPTTTPSQPEPPLPTGSVTTAPCPIHLADNRTDGGLQSLIDFAPAFGPFSAEAFAMASTYQPALQLIGPILAKYPTLAPQIEPLLNPLIDDWRQLLDQGFALLGPLYSPYRTSVLESETKLAAALAPYAQKLTASPLGGCLIELQNALLHDSAANAEAGR